MRKLFVRLPLLVVAAALLLLVGCGKEEVTQFVATASINAAPEALNSVNITLPENMPREVVSDIQHDFTLDGHQVGGIILVDIPKDLMDSPVKGLIDIVELLRQQLMPNVPEEEAEIICFGGSENAYMELVTGPDEQAYYHFLFRGVNNTYDVWFNWEALEQDSEMIYEIVNSVTGEDILPENNQNPF